MLYLHFDCWLETAAEGVFWHGSSVLAYVDDAAVTAGPRGSGIRTHERPIHHFVVGLLHVLEIDKPGQVDLSIREGLVSQIPPKNFKALVASMPFCSEEVSQHPGVEVEDAGAFSDGLNTDPYRARAQRPSYVLVLPAFELPENIPL